MSAFSFLNPTNLIKYISNKWRSIMEKREVSKCNTIAQSRQYLKEQFLMKKTLINQQLDEGSEDIRKRILLASDAFYSNLACKVPSWVRGANCQERVNNIFYVKRQINAYTTELINCVSLEMKSETQSWVQSRFIPLLRTEIQTLAETVNADTSTYWSELDDLRVSLNLDRDKIVNKTAPSTKNRVLSSGASLLIGDLGGAIMGGAGGFDATLKTIGCEFGTGLILGIASLFTPIGLPAIIVSVIISAFISGKWALRSIEEKIQKEVIDEIVKNLKSDCPKEKFNHMIISTVDKSLVELRKNVNAQWDAWFNKQVHGVTA